MLFFMTSLNKKLNRTRSSVRALLAFSRSWDVPSSPGRREPWVAVWPEVTDGAGNVVTSVGENDEFMLRVYAEDLRSNPEGVFAAYVDIPFDTGLVQLNGSVIHGPLFPNVTSADSSTDGLLNDFGGAGLLTPSGSGPLLVFEQPMKSLSAGSVDFSLATGDNPPFTDVLLYGNNTATPLDVIQFGSTTLSIVPEPSSCGLFALGLVCWRFVVGSDRNHEMSLDLSHRRIDCSTGSTSAATGRAARADMEHAENGMFDGSAMLRVLRPRN